MRGEWGKCWQIRSQNSCGDFHIGAHFIQMWACPLKALCEMNAARLFSIHTAQERWKKKGTPEENLFEGSSEMGSRTRWWSRSTGGAAQTSRKRNGTHGNPFQEMIPHYLTPIVFCFGCVAVGNWRSWRWIVAALIKSVRRGLGWRNNSTCFSLSTHLGYLIKSIYSV